jgi:hypothetical protein
VKPAASVVSDVKLAVSGVSDVKPTESVVSERETGRVRPEREAGGIGRVGGGIDSVRLQPDRRNDDF